MLPIKGFELKFSGSRSEAEDLKRQTDSESSLLNQRLQKIPFLIQEATRNQDFMTISALQAEMAWGVTQLTQLKIRSEVLQAEIHFFLAEELDQKLFVAQELLNSADLEFQKAKGVFYGLQREYHGLRDQKQAEIDRCRRASSQAYQLGQAAGATKYKNFTMAAIDQIIFDNATEDQ